MENNPQPEKKNKNTLWVVLLALSVLLNIYQWRKQSNTITVYEQRVDTLIIERVNVEKELNDTRTELNNYKGMNAQLDSLLADANIKVDEQDKRIKSLIKKEKNSTELNNKLRGELDELKKMREEYLGKIDSLLVANQALTVEKEMLSSSVKSLTKNLESTVSTASVLAAEYIKVTPYKKKSEGKYTTTALARRTNKVEVCFDILENKIAKAGNKNIYLRILTPDGKVMGERATGSGTFKKEGSGEEVLYSTTSSVDYKNTKQNVCINYEEAERIYPKGTFNVEVYVDENLSGTTTFTLK
jgi:predicted  nucleic acid-binding Zn-ribbon protein